MTGFVWLVDLIEVLGLLISDIVFEVLPGGSFWFEMTAVSAETTQVLRCWGW